MKEVPMWRRTLSLTTSARMAAFTTAAAVSALGTASPAFAEETTPGEKGKGFLDTFFSGDNGRFVWTVVITIAAFMLLGLIIATKGFLGLVFRLMAAVAFGVITYVVYSVVFVGNPNNFVHRTIDINGVYQRLSKGNLQYMALYLIPLGLMLAFRKNKFASFVVLVGGILLTNAIIVTYVPLPPV